MEQMLHVIIGYEIDIMFLLRQDIKKIKISSADDWVMVYGWKVLVITKHWKVFSNYISSN